jgi:hypothetical protein
MANRHRPKVGFTVDPIVVEKLRKRADATGEAQSAIAERALRVDLGSGESADEVPS